MDDRYIYVTDSPSNHEEEEDSSNSDVVFVSFVSKDSKKEEEEDQSEDQSQDNQPQAVILPPQQDAAPHIFTEDDLKEALRSIQDDPEVYNPFSIVLPEAVPAQPVPDVQIISAIPAPRKPEGAILEQPPNRSEKYNKDDLPLIPDVPTPPKAQRAPKGSNDYRAIMNAIMASCTLEKIDFSEINQMEKVRGTAAEENQFNALVQYAQGGIASSDAMLRRMWSGCFFFKWNNKRYCLANYSRMADSSKTNQGCVKRMMKKWGYRESNKVFDRSEFDEYLSKWGLDPNDWILYESKVLF